MRERHERPLNKQPANDLKAGVGHGTLLTYVTFPQDAALVGGIAAKKLGLLATLGVLVAKFGKLIIVGVVALGAGAVKFFKGRKQDGSAA